MHPGIDARADAEIASLHAEMQSQMVTPACRDGAPLRARCGLFLRYAATPEAQERFQQQECASRTEAACEAHRQRTVHENLQRRYALARFRDVDAWCGAQVPQCASDAYELQLIASHNAEVRSRAERRETYVEARREDEKAADTEASLTTAAVVLQFLDVGLRLAAAMVKH